MHPGAVMSITVAVGSSLGRMAGTFKWTFGHSAKQLLSEESACQFVSLLVITNGGKELPFRRKLLQQASRPSRL